MRDLHLLDEYRDRSGDVMEIYGFVGDSTCGVFRFNNRPGVALLVIASARKGWDHVSVSTANRCPNWPEMEYIKRLFFKDDETAMQLHVPPKDHINCEHHTLHLWRPQNVDIPRPPGWMIALGRGDGALK